MPGLCSQQCPPVPKICIIMSLALSANAVQVIAALRHTPLNFCNVLCQDGTVQNSSY